MRINWLLSDLHACGHVRGEVLAREINATHPNHEIVCKMELLASDLFKTNLMVFQRCHEPKMLEFVKICKRRGIKTIYEIDDDLFNLPLEFHKPYDFYAKPEVRAVIAQIMENCDAVTVTTHALALALKKYNPTTPTFVIPNYLDVGEWNEAYHHKLNQQCKPLTIGWMASGSHLLDAPLVHGALKRIMEENEHVRLHFIGWIGFDNVPELSQFKDRITVESWVSIAVLPSHMSNFDIGIAPLVRCNFNDCKSNIKWQQYSALGIPSIVSKVPAYENVTNMSNGIVVKDDSQDSWYECLNMLVKDAKIREDIGNKAHIDVAKNWDIKNNASVWIKTFEQILK